MHWLKHLSTRNQIICAHAVVLAFVLVPQRALAQQDSTLKDLAPVQPTFMIHVDSSWVQALAGKTRKEILGKFGIPAFGDKESFLYEAKVPGYFGEQDGHLSIIFANDKAYQFMVDSASPINETFVRLTLQSAPGAHFEPSFKGNNLTGQDWADRHTGFFARTIQVKEKHYLFSVILAPAKAP